MSLPPQVEAEGLLAYEQARAFENLQRLHLPLIYVGFAVLLLIAGGAALKLGHSEVGGVALFFGVFIPILEWVFWRNLRARHAKNLALLARLESQYGNQLPWIQVEQHFAALERLQADLAEEKRKGEPPNPPLSS